MIQAQDLTCIHRWILSEPSKGRVTGSCRRCGATKSYPAGIEMPPPPQEPEEEEEEEVLDVPELAASLASMERHVLV